MTEEPIPGSRVRATTPHGALTVDEVAAMQPGGARLMDEVAHRMWVLYYAAKGGNWDLARYMETESEKALAFLAKARPKYAQDLELFRAQELAALAHAIEAKEFEAFDAAFRRCVEASDVYHGKYDKPFIRFRLPDRPPEWFDLAP